MVTPELNCRMVRAGLRGGLTCDKQAGCKEVIEGFFGGGDERLTAA